MGPSSEYVHCDPRDARCKCGPFALDLVCTPNEVCERHGEDSYACRNVACDLVHCKKGEVCNPDSGDCQCGTGPSCRPDQLCDNGQCMPP